MRKNRLFVCFALILFCLSLSAQDQSHPNFTGRWKLDAGRSTLGNHGPDAATLYIYQNDPDFHIRSTETQNGKSIAWSAHGRTDGRPMDQKTREGMKHTHMYWQGSQLVLEWKADGKDGETRRIVRYTLSDGGKTLTAHETQDDRESKLVFIKTGKIG